jgi:hypothetical protein
VPDGIEVLRVPWLHGPVHDWLIVPGWLHQRLHDEDVEHEHRPEPACRCGGEPGGGCSFAGAGIPWCWAARVSGR